jgi:hypothetical protein
MTPGSGCPHDCPCGAPKQRLQGQRQPTRSIVEVKEDERFTREIEDVREADFRLANHRLQPLGHLTALVSICEIGSSIGRDFVEAGRRSFGPASLARNSNKRKVSSEKPVGTRSPVPSVQQRVPRLRLGNCGLPGAPCLPVAHDAAQPGVSGLGARCPRSFRGMPPAAAAILARSIRLETWLRGPEATA